MTNFNVIQSLFRDYLMRPQIYGQMINCGRKEPRGKSRMGDFSFSLIVKRFIYPLFNVVLGGGFIRIAAILCNVFVHVNRALNILRRGISRLSRV